MTQCNVQELCLKVSDIRCGNHSTYARALPDNHLTSVDDDKNLNDINDLTHSIPYNYYYKAEHQGKRGGNSLILVPFDAGRDAFWGILVL